MNLKTIKNLISIILVFGLTSIASAQSSISSYDDALKLAQEKNQNILLFFTASWCTPCKQMKKEVFTDPEVSEKILAQHILVYCDIDSPEGRELKVRYNIDKGVPVLVIVNSKEEILMRKDGGMDKADLSQFISNSTKQSQKENGLKAGIKDARYITILYGLNDSLEREAMKSILDAPKVKNKISERKFITSDFNLGETKYAKWLKKSKKDNISPIIFVQDKYKKYLARHAGRINESEMIRLLELDTATMDLSKYKSLITMKEHGAAYKFIGKMLSCEWRPGISVGINSMKLNNSAFDHSKTGYELGFIMDYTPKKLEGKFVFQSGFIFNSIGGHSKELSKDIRLNYLEVPLRFNYKIFNHKIVGCPQPVRASFAPYCAYRIGGKNTGELSHLRNWDYGIKTGLNIAFGTWDAFLGYQHGLADLSSSSNMDFSNRGFFFSTTMVFGK
ncbi:hypothetical protein DF185_07220 [Marinifilum breve]|uniref:Thioredoxin domain-containing protein n=1 Tax=Marinifilum breve TaxID=2184082 RepID=A0A2V4A0Z8_9BACT|nr:thioredoxin family protein [Marinifilum breve]PXY02432.1 hypothetical protein DF185_07220 [Marinifilum breve]